MANKKHIFIVLLLSFFAFSCEESFKIGADFLPTGDFLDIQITDTVEVFLTTELTEKIRTDNSGSLLVGKYNDPYFGSTQAGFITQVLENTYPNFPDGIILDSICLQFQLYENDGVYGDSTPPFDFTVYEVTQTLSNLSTQYYYSNESPENYTNFDILGTGTANIYYFEEKDKDKKTIIYKGMSLKLNNSFGQRLIDDDDRYFYSYGTNFSEIFKGIYVESNSNNQAIYKIRTTITSDSSDFGMIMYYHTDSSTTPQTYIMLINTSSARFNLFEHDYTNVPFVNNDKTIRDSLVYLQSMAGTVLKFEAPGLKNFENIVINKAELLLPVAPNTYDNFKPIDYLWFAAYDTADNIVYFEDFAGSSYQGADLTDNNTYSFYITRIVQDLIQNIYQNLPFELYITNLASSVDFKRSIITNGNHSKPTKLIITYSKYKN